VCTVSWSHESDGGYQLLCNRDEKRTRKHVIEPRLHCTGGTRYIAPVDGDFGGTWIGVNELAVSVCLLNGYGVPRGHVSRGLLVIELLRSRSAAGAVESAATRDLAQFSPFTVLALEPGRPAALCVWDGTLSRIFADGEAFVPLVSSSLDQFAAEQARKRAFEQAESLDSFHRDHLDGPSAYSPCMHRNDAETVSFSRVHVSRSEITLAYSPAAPCRRLPPITRTIAR
jgi:hypothetical protein